MGFLSAWGHVSIVSGKFTFLQYAGVKKDGLLYVKTTAGVAVGRIADA